MQTMLIDMIKEIRSLRLYLFFSLDLDLQLDEMKKSILLAQEAHAEDVGTLRAQYECEKQVGKQSVGHFWV